MAGVPCGVAGVVRQRRLIRYSHAVVIQGSLLGWFPADSHY